MPETLSEAPDTEKDSLPAMGFLEHLESRGHLADFRSLAMMSDRRGEVALGQRSHRRDNRFDSA